MDGACSTLGILSGLYSHILGPSRRRLVVVFVYSFALHDLRPLRASVIHTLHLSPFPVFALGRVGNFNLA